MKIVVWNTQWAVPDSNRGQVLSEQIQSKQPDLICLTEANAGLLPQDGHVIESSPDYGYQLFRVTSHPGLSGEYFFISSVV